MVSHWDKKQLTEEHVLRDVLYYLFSNNVVTGATQEAAKNELTRLLGEKFPRMKERRRGLPLAVDEAFDRQFIIFDVQSQSLRLSEECRATLNELDIITSSCGASMVRENSRAAIYCHNCGSLM